MSHMCLNQDNRDPRLARAPIAPYKRNMSSKPGDSETGGHPAERTPEHSIAARAFWAGLVDARMFRLISRVFRRFVRDQGFQRASALAYATLLAIVPLVALGMVVFTNSQTFAEIAQHVRSALVQHLVPASREAIEAYLSTVAERSTALSVFGILGLLITATALLNTMEEAFNHIWRITRARPWLSRFVTFWATLTLAPLLIGASLTITSYFAALPVLRDVAAGASRIGDIPFLLPWLMSALALTTMYMVLPNTSVPFPHASIGGMVAGALFELCKLGFTFYVTEIANYQRIYGALSTLPIFLVWLYLAWVVVLLGAELVYCLQHPESDGQARRQLLRPGIRQFFAHLILIRAAEAHARGDALTFEGIKKEIGAPDDLLESWLDELSRNRLLHPVESAETRAWTLARDAEHLKLDLIHRSLNADSMTIPEGWRETALGRALASIYFQLERQRRERLGAISLADLAAKVADSEPAD
ncbi:MAG: YihY family inner membrane protein [Gammaproteobacteria bacterium]|nr:MAG: YihY family inner membrane protein [Gammaproteobacteria bacterium]